MDGINLGQVLTIVVTLIGMSAMAIGFIWAIKANTLVLDARLSANSSRLDESNRQLLEMQKDLKALNGVVTSLALQDQRTSVLEQRLTAQEKRLEIQDQRYEELRHGEGFTFPLSEAMRVRLGER